MKFECGDLERAFANPDLMKDAREHIVSCAACRKEYRLWMDISSAAKELREEWETPALWPRIRESLAAEQKPEVNRWQHWKIWAIAATVIVAVTASLLFERRLTKPAEVHQAQAAKAAPANPDFLTEQALQDVEKSEKAYRQSIDRLYHLAEPKLEKSASASVVNAREKLLMLDSAIEDTRNNVASNRFNVRLQTTLAELYKEKQQTLKELLTSDQRN
jgi:hypothetical protein